ncbi:MAG: ABC transporter ATP-binding protein [Clostridiaceae bacterium]|nr:ABC transporter ATP-binding protein [Clostridiaceae bacterium]
MLEIKNIRGGYFKKEVLHSVSLGAHAGQVTAILGPNGCGKSTLLKSICGILPVISGQVLLNGENLLALSQNQIAQKIAYLSQSKQIPDITVKRLILHGRFPYLSYPRRYRQEDFLAVKKVMEQMKIMELAEIPLNQLSGGQQQKAYIAMALAQDTSIILLDEPTTYLDISHQLQILQQVRELANSGKYIIMVIHDLAYALETADQIVLMQEGLVVMQGTPEKIYETGILDKIFDIKMARVHIDKQWHYFCAKK